MGVCRAHFFNDLWPRAKLEDLAHLQRFVETFGKLIPERKNEEGSPKDRNIEGLHSLSPFVSLILREMGADFASFVKGNARATLMKERAFTAHVYGENVSYLQRPYVEKSRRNLQRWMGCHLERTGRDGDEHILVTILRHFNLEELYHPIMPRQYTRRGSVENNCKSCRL